MFTLKIYAFTALISLCHIYSALAQEAVTSTGANASGSGGTLSYTIGLVVYTTNINVSGNSAQGVQHAFEIFTIGTEDILFGYDITAYPNPSSGEISIKISSEKQRELKFSIYDLKGRIIRSGNLHEDITRVDLSDIPNAPYQLIIQDDLNKRVKTFRLVKSN
jgi:hypothetical protein